MYILVYIYIVQMQCSTTNLCRCASISARVSPSDRCSAHLCSSFGPLLLLLALLPLPVAAAVPVAVPLLLLVAAAGAATAGAAIGVPCCVVSCFTASTAASAAATAAADCAISSCAASSPRFCNCTHRVVSSSGDQQCSVAQTSGMLAAHARYAQSANTTHDAQRML
jgi:hypothetical protein